MSLVAVAGSCIVAFAPLPPLAHHAKSSLIQPFSFLPAARTALPVANLDALTLDSVSSTMAFADQAGNLAGALFPASLPAYGLFLYFICQDRNGLSQTAKAATTSRVAAIIWGGAL